MEVGEYELVLGRDAPPLQGAPIPARIKAGADRCMADNSRLPALWKKLVAGVDEGKPVTPG